MHTASWGSVLPKTFTGKVRFYKLMAFVSVLFVPDNVHKMIDMLWRKYMILKEQ